VRYRDLYVRRVRERCRMRGIIPPLVAVVVTDDNGAPAGMKVYLCEEYTLWLNCFVEPLAFPEDWVDVDTLPLLSDLFTEIRGLYPDLVVTPQNIQAFSLIRGSRRTLQTIELPDLATATQLIRRKFARFNKATIVNHVRSGPYPRADYLYDPSHQPKPRHRLRIPTGGYTRVGSLKKHTEGPADSDRHAKFSKSFGPQKPL